jgi:hypothetical protein
MKDVTADKANHTARNVADPSSPDPRTALDRRYEQIGISAVAAAARYQGAAKNPAYAPVPTRWDRAEF